MKDEFRLWLSEIAAHPAAFGFVAALARWALGDRVGGWRSLFSYVITSLLVAWAASFWLADEVGMSIGRKSFYLLLAAFVAKDVLIALVALSTQFGTNPIEVLQRIRAALAGGPKP
ncbi:MAG: hypothetical protein V4792_09995 [Pseudomonadota bacterium]